VRSIESSALHILRIMQEEAMKENTAAVHVQVPVDVGTFLLNEKRNDIHALEARLKVNIILLPNMHLETPNYKIERLRHDDLNQEGVLPPSYRMVEAPAEEEKKLLLPEAKPARPEALVKGVTPEQPAPVPAQAAPAPAPAAPAAPVVQPVGIIDKIFGWFRRPAAAPQPAAAPVRPVSPEPRREHRERRERFERGRGGRDRGERRERHEGRPQGPRPPERPQQPGGGERRERGGEPAGREGRPPQRERGERRERRPEHEGRPQMPPSGAPAGGPEGQAAEGERRGGRRRRRGRGGDRGERAGQPRQVSGAGVPAAAVPVEAVTVAPAPAAAPGERAFAPELPREPVPAAAVEVPMREPIAPSVAPEPVAPAITAGRVEEPAEQVRETLAPRVVAEPQAEIVVRAAPVVPAVSAPVPQPDLDEALRQSGLVLIETDPTKAKPVATVAEEVPAAPRAPRERRPAPIGLDEPLVQVETHKSDQAPV
jgi:ribonuclease E